MKKIALIAIAVVLIGYIALRAWACTVYTYDRDVENQDRIAKAYISFYRDKNEPAASLKELVSAGYLPARGTFYREPPGFWSQECDVSLSSYQIFPLSEDGLAKLKILGRKSREGSWDFNPPINSQIRDGITGLRSSRTAQPGN